MGKATPLVLLLLLSWAGALAAAAPASNAGARPRNILLITIDTWRFDRLGCNRPGLVRTPRLDAMAARGINFTRAFAHNPETLPSHANMMTGVTALTHGVYDNNGFKLHEDSLTLAEHLKKSGYRTFAAVASFVLSSQFGISQGFDEYVEPAGKETSLAEEVVDEAMRLISRQRGKWFGWVHLWDPHYPYSPPAPFAQAYRDDPYSGEVAYADEQLGRLFDLLEERKILPDTLLIVTGDHGEGLGEHGEKEHGFFAYNSTIHIPLFIVAPGGKKGTSDAYACHIDIFPTVCRAAGIPAPQGLHGVPLLAGGAAPERAIYFESKAPYFTKGWAPLEGFIRNGMKYIDLPIKELYDLKEDIAERKNIISRVKAGDLARRLQDTKDRLSGRFREGSAMLLSPEARQKLETFGYLSGFKQERKSRYGREDDLKTLLPLQNMLLQAQHHYLEREYGQAAGLCEKILAQRPDEVGSIMLLADVHARMNQPQKAVGVIRAGLARVPQNVELKLKLGGLLASGDAGPEALALLNEVLLLQPQRSEAWNFLGVAHFRRGELGKAGEAYEKALALEPGSATTLNNLGTLFLTQFLRRRSQELLDRAMDAFNRALERNPRLESAYNGRATAYKFSGKSGEAVADWKKAIELNPDFIDPYFNIGITCLETGDPAEALRYLDECLARHADRLSPAERERLQRLIAEAKRSH